MLVTQNDHCIPPIPHIPPETTRARTHICTQTFLELSIWGKSGNFTDAKVLGRLRGALLEVAQKDVGKKIVKDVLIIEIARQDY